MYDELVGLAVTFGCPMLCVTDAVCDELLYAMYELRCYVIHVACMCVDLRGEKWGAW